MYVNCASEFDCGHGPLELFLYCLIMSADRLSRPLFIYVPCVLCCQTGIWERAYITSVVASSCASLFS